MGMKEGEQLDHVLTIRVSTRFFESLEEKRKHTNCRSVSEMARAILYNEKINFYYTDSTLNATAIELAAVRKELNQIGNNINQVVKAFHLTNDESRKIFYAMQGVEQYKSVDVKVEKLLIMISSISEKWLQK